MARTRTSGKRILIILGVLVGLLILVGVAGNALGWFGGEERGETVESAVAGRRTITQVVTASGRVEPETEVKISPDVSGEVILLTVKEGDAVTAGQVLARIRPDVYAAQAEQLEASVQQSQAGVEQGAAGVTSAREGVARAERELDRVRNLQARGLTATAELETAQSAVRAQQAALAQAVANASQSRFGVTSAQARLREAREQLGKTTITAPMSGTVSQLNIEAGERVVGTSQMAGTELMRIARLESMELVVDVNENDVVNITLGDTARVEVDAYPDRPLRGVVTEIAQSARVGAQATGSQQVTNFQVRVRVEGNAAARTTAGGALAPEVQPPQMGETRLRPGMSGTVDIYTQTVREAVAIPIAAVTVRDLNKVRLDTLEGSEGRKQRRLAAGAPQPEELRKIVFVIRGGKARMVEVDTGIDDRTYVEVRRGLRPGDEIVTGPYSLVSRTLLPGKPVQTERADAARAQED